MSTNTKDGDGYRLDSQLLADLWIFRIAARLGSITAAASRLNVTQGAVSHRVIRLEGRLGAPLFSRKSGRLLLNNAGEQVLEAMNDVAMRLGDALNRFDQIQRTSLVVSCVPSLATEWLVPRLDSFYDEHPDIELFIRAEMSMANVEAAEQSGIDVLIGYQREATKGFHQLACFDELIFPVCSRAYREGLENGSQPGITRLHDGVPWDEFHPKPEPRDTEWLAWQACHPQWRPDVIADRHFNLANLAYHAALSGQGVAIGRSVLINRLVGRGELIPAIDLPPVPGATYRLLTLRPGDSRSAVRKFAKWVIRTMEATQAESLALVSP